MNPEITNEAREAAPVPYFEILCPHHISATECLPCLQAERLKNMDLVAEAGQIKDQHEHFKNDNRLLRKRLSAQAVRIAELKKALKAADYFTHVGVSRGPASEEWMNMRKLVEELIGNGDEDEISPSSPSPVHDEREERGDVFHKDWAERKKA